jgi:hypothetical protein
MRVGVATEVELGGAAEDVFIMVRRAPGAQHWPKIMRITGLDRKFLAPRRRPRYFAADLRSPSPFGPHNALICTAPLARQQAAATVQAEVCAQP